jgi:hypothetical protein
MPARRRSRRTDVAVLARLDDAVLPHTLAVGDRSRDEHPAHEDGEDAGE